MVAQFLELICPSSCAVCNRVPEEPGEQLCENCWRSLREGIDQEYCHCCGHTAGAFSLLEGRCHRCQARRPHVTRLVRVGEYDRTLQQLIWALKYRRQERLDNLLGRLLASAILGDPKLQDVHVLVPVPLHWWRRLRRGYNQAEILAHSCAAELRRHGRRVRVRTDLLRVRATEPQFTLPPSRKAANLRHAFAVRPDAPFTAKHVCLIDDVTTSGATLNAAGRVLRPTQPACISAAVLAAAGNR